MDFLHRLPYRLLPLINVDDIEMLTPVDVIQKIQNCWNILVNKESKSNPDWQNILVFVADDCLLVLVDIPDRSVSH